METTARPTPPRAGPTVGGTPHRGRSRRPALTWIAAARTHLRADNWTPCCGAYGASSGGSSRFTAGRRHQILLPAPVRLGPVMMFRSGQYLTVRLNVPGQESVTHQFRAPGRDHYRISRSGRLSETRRRTTRHGVRRRHEEVGPGDVIQVAAGRDFFLDEASCRPLVLLRGGVGLTPMVSMLEHLVGRGTPPETWYARRIPRRSPARDEQHVRDLANANGPIHPGRVRRAPRTRGRARPTTTRPAGSRWIGLAVAPVADAHFYFWGPAASCACSRSAGAPWTCPTNASTSKSSTGEALYA